MTTRATASGSTALSYAGAFLDRAGSLRKDPTWIDRHLDRPATRILPLWRNRNLVDGAGTVLSQPTAVLRQRAEAADVVRAASELVFLGLAGEDAVFAADLSDVDEATAAGLVGGGSFVDLRQVGPLISARDANLAAYGRGILHWHCRHRFCSRCGHPSVGRDGGQVRVCTNSDCGQTTFPRIDPAVIMLVEHRPDGGEPPRCLMGRHVRLPPGVFSTLAGFVEPAESLEQTVAREVLEETGVVVDQVTYQGSQPWPFPSSIMLGFRARARSTAITIDEDELDEAHWFTADEVRSFGEWGDETASRKLPRRDSIARFLVESWLAEIS